MSDLTEFLRARLTEDEEAARAATNHTGQWNWEHDTGDMCNDPTCPYGELVDAAEPGERVAGTVLMQVHGYDITEPWQGAAHIARHDPARVLAEVEAKREVVRLAVQALTNAELPDPEHATGPYVPAVFVSGCASAWEHTVRLLAVPYAAHPEYRPEWGPIA